jgi:hypothetical protein
MMYMIRKQLYIDERHERLLKQRAAEQGLSEAELVRRALDLLLAETEGPMTVPPARLDALKELLERAERAARAPSDEGWYFDREEVYDERERRALR